MRHLRLSEAVHQIGGRSDVPRVLLREISADLASVLEAGKGFQEDWETRMEY